MTKPDRKFFFVMANGVHGKPLFARRGIAFYAHKWRPIELGDRDDLGASPPLVSKATLDAIAYETVERPNPKHPGEDKPGTAPPMLTMREASAEEVRRHLEEKRALEPRDRLQEAEEELAAAKQRLVDLEARLMKLELPNPKPSKERS